MKWFRVIAFVLVSVALMSASTTLSRSPGRDGSGDLQYRRVTARAIVASPTPTLRPTLTYTSLLGKLNEPEPSPSPLPSPSSTPRPTPKPTAAPQPKPAGWRWPVGGNISQYYSGRHPAIDIAGKCGSKVVASRNGKVVFSGWKDNRGGYQVWIDHGSTASGYYHLSGVAVKRGVSVGAGQVIGYRGRTGHATGCHLHFEIWKGNIWQGTRLNPLKYL